MCGRAVTLRVVRRRHSGPDPSLRFWSIRPVDQEEAGVSQSPRLEVFQHRPHSCLLFIVHLVRVEVHEKHF
jgi:hypothetical protein